MIGLWKYAQEKIEEMVFLVHRKGEPKEVLIDLEHRIDIDLNRSKSSGELLMKLAEIYPREYVGWCDYNVLKLCNIEKLKKSLGHDRMMVSCLDRNPNFSPKIGYVDQSSFIKVNRQVQYPTWIMSSSAGAIHASVLIEYKGLFRIDSHFDYFLNSISKNLMPLGLFCYHIPGLIGQKGVNTSTSESPENHNMLFRFVKEYYGLKWTLFLLTTFVLYEKKWKLKPFLLSLLYRKKSIAKPMLGDPNWVSPKILLKKEIDLVVPTLGRKKLLENFLMDLNNQSLLPRKVIVVEQKKDNHPDSQLKELNDKNWKFILEIIFLDKAGVCHARNIGLARTSCPWVFLADDDIRIGNNALAEIFEGIEKTQARALSASCLRSGQRKKRQWFFQSSIFGAGCSIVDGDIAREISFNTAFEFGYGEDSDYGMQLRNKGIDIIFSPMPEIIHLKSPTGGFRTEFQHPWSDESTQPKPSPQVMLFHKLHRTTEQLLGYKLWLFLNLIKKYKPMNPIKFSKKFKSRWNSSLKWAGVLANRTTNNTF